jgi:purine nucleoside phosphorylase
LINNYNIFFIYVSCLVPEWHVGDIALITDHINFFGTNPLIGPNEDLFPPHSVRFPDMSNCYDDKVILKKYFFFLF